METLASKHHNKAEWQALPSADEVLDKIGLGWGQAATLVLCCGPFLVEGMELTLMSLFSGLPLRSSMLGDGSQGTGYLVSTLLLGALLGNITLGPCADGLGRQFPIIFAYAAILVLGLASSFLHSLTAVVACQFIMGLALGAAQPAAVALINEIVPSRSRFVCTACTTLSFGVGMMSGVFLVFSQHWNMRLEGERPHAWRNTLRMAMLIPMMLFFLSIFFLRESPQFLAASGDHAAAHDTMESLRKRNCAGPMPVDFRFVQSDTLASIVRPFKLLSQLVDSPATLSVCSVSMVLSFALYGSGYAAPQVLKAIIPSDSQSVPAGVMLLTSMVFLVASLILVICFIEAYGDKRRQIMNCLLLSMGSAMLFIVCATENPGVVRCVILVMACCGLGLGPALGSIYVMICSATMHSPTTSASIVGACLTMGRLGCIVAPLACDWLPGILGGSFMCFFGLCVLLEFGCIASMVALRHPSWAERRSADDK